MFVERWDNNPSTSSPEISAQQVAAEGISKVMNNAVDNPVIQRNIHTIRAWLDAHTART
jgi:hypothetical protein